VNRSRKCASLAYLWAAGFVAAIAGVLYLRWRVPIGPESASKLMESVISQYAPYLGAVLGYWFAGQAPKRHTESSIVPFRLAIILSCLWNLVTLGSIYRACFDPKLTQDSMRDVATIVPKLAWVVAPAIGYFFGKPGEARDA
jgi:hypothetical protein